MYSEEDVLEHPHISKGLHYLCVTPHNSTHNTMTIYKDALPTSPTTLLVPTTTSPSSLNHLLTASSILPSSSLPLTFSPQYYTQTGLPLSSPSTFLTHNIVLLYEGGSFMWPGVRLNHTWTVPTTTGGVMTLRTLSLTPLVLSLDESFLDESEINTIITKASPHLKNSGVSLMDHDKGKQAKEWRTSSTHFLATRGDSMMETIDKRVSEVTKLGLNQQESIQVLRYEKTQKYDGHHDYFDRKFYGSDQSTLKLIDNGAKNRLATAFFYLTDVEKGGETIFYRSGGIGQPRSFDDCDNNKYLKVKPKAGRIIIFYSLRYNGDLDEYSLHGGCPVKEGVKFSGNKWIWNRRTEISEYQ
jgi:prolyl 4-hydroxylase